jgi:hypothetical protein
VSFVAAPVALRFEHQTDVPLGLDTGAPRLSWIVPEADVTFAQEAYEIEIDGGRSAS